MRFIQILFIPNNCPSTEAIEDADSHFFSMIDEETERRVAELESQERLKSKILKAQKTNGVDSTEESHREQSDGETDVSVQINDSNVTNGHNKENGHTNGHTNGHDEK